MLLCCAVLCFVGLGIMCSKVGWLVGSDNDVASAVDVPIKERTVPAIVGS